MRHFVRHLINIYLIRNTFASIKKENQTLLMDFIMSNKYKGGIRNPLVGTRKNAQFKYEVLDLSEVKNVTYFDGDKDIEEPERQILIGTLTGGLAWSQEKFLCTIAGNDALKPLREGEIISAILHFNVRENEDDIYEQSISATDIYTLNDYFLIREAEARHQGSLDSSKTN